MKTALSADIDGCLAYSHVLVHIEPCLEGCELCVAECPKLGTASC